MDTANAGLELGKIIAQLGSTGILGLMWWLERAGRLDAQSKNEVLQGERLKDRDQQLSTQKDLLKMFGDRDNASASDSRGH